MKKQLKAVLALLLVLCIFFSVTACGTPAAKEEEPAKEAETKPAADEKEPAEEAEEPAGEEVDMPEWSCALEYSSSQTSLNLAVTHYIEYLAEALNGKVQVVEYQGDEQHINVTQDLVNAGVDFIISENINKACLESMVKVCEDGEVYLAQIHARLGEEIHAPVKDSKYFVGYFWQDEQEAGEGMANALIDQGFKKFIVVCPTVGTSVANDYRIKGVKDVVEARKDEGVEIVAEINYASGQNVAACQTAMTNEEGDALIVSGGGLNCAIQPMREAGKLGKIGFATVDFDDYDTTLEALTDGWANSLRGGHFADGVFAFVACYNAWIGQPLSETPLYDYGFKYMNLTSGEEYEKYAEYCENFERPAFDIDEVKQMLRNFNPDFTLEEYAEILEGYNLDSVLERRGVK